MKILVTGGAGFIGSSVIRHIIKKTDFCVVNVDKLTYAGNLESLHDVEKSGRYSFEQVDICNAEEIKRVFLKHEPDLVMHLAAESHVDKSIAGPGQFIKTNINGTYILLEAACNYWMNLDSRRKEVFKFHHISTDEVYGDLPHPDDCSEFPLPIFVETSPYNPSSPYSASKAASDHLVAAWSRTYNLPVVTSNCSNNYGPFQFPEKLIPLTILQALEGKTIPVYGNGQQIRDWLYVDDHVEALMLVATKSKSGEFFNIGGNNERRNIEVVETVCNILDELKPPRNNDLGITNYAQLISFVDDRPGHDKRYAIDSSKIQDELGWEPKETFDSGIKKTVSWYLENTDWCKRMLDGSYMKVKSEDNN